MTTSYVSQLTSLFCVLICFVTSAIYHHYLVLGRKYYSCLLRVDLIGIGCVVFGNGICLSYVALHNFDKVQHLMVGLLTTFFLMNLVT